MNKNNLKTLFSFLKDVDNSRLSLGIKLIFDYPIDKKDLKVKGSMNLRNTTNITSLPDNLQVEEHLLLYRSHIKSVPYNLYVGRNLLLASTNITDLNENLYVGGRLDLRYCKNLKEITHVFKCLGTTDLEKSAIEKLPDNLDIYDLDLRETPIKKLPNNLHISENLYLYDTDIYELPDDLVVGGNIYTNGTQRKLWREQYPHRANSIPR